MPHPRRTPDEAHSRAKAKRSKRLAAKRRDRK